MLIQRLVDFENSYKKELHLVLVACETLKLSVLGMFECTQALDEGAFEDDTEEEKGDNSHDEASIHDRIAAALVVHYPDVRPSETIPLYLGKQASTLHHSRNQYNNLHQALCDEVTLESEHRSNCQKSGVPSFLLNPNFITCGYFTPARGQLQLI